MSILRTIRYIARHPLSRDRRLRNLTAFAAWQIGARLVPGPVAIPFTSEAQLLAKPGMTSATGHIYVGLQEFEDMAFVVHALRPGDWFADVGANIGAYTILAGAVAGADVVAFEPGAEARGWLEKNTALNRIGARVEIRSEVVGETQGEVEFSVDRDTTNAVVTKGAGPSTAAVRTVSKPMTTLDVVCGERCPAVIKIDVEGFETKVVEGSAGLLSRPELLALVIEMNGSGANYGFDEAVLTANLRSHGFETFHYHPFERRLLPLESGASRTADNVIFARSLNILGQRLRDARTFMVNDLTI